jgi:hypothetical protein
MNLNSTKRHLPERNVKLCDCGQPAYKRDGSGCFCEACEQAVQLAQSSLDEHIRKRRREEFINSFKYPRHD